MYSRWWVREGVRESDSSTTGRQLQQKRKTDIVMKRKTRWNSHVSFPSSLFMCASGDSISLTKEEKQFWKEGIHAYTLSKWQLDGVLTSFLLSKGREDPYHLVSSSFHQNSSIADPTNHVCVFILGQMGRDRQEEKEKIVGKTGSEQKQELRDEREYLIEIWFTHFLWLVSQTSSSLTRHRWDSERHQKPHHQPDSWPYSFIHKSVASLLKMANICTLKNYRVVQEENGAQLTERHIFIKSQKSLLQGRHTSCRFLSYPRVGESDQNGNVRRRDTEMLTNWNNTHKKKFYHANINIEREKNAKEKYTTK